MTREYAKQLIFKASKDDTSSPKNCIHLLSLHMFIEKIYDDFEEELKKAYIEGGNDVAWKALNCKELDK
jgi:hypothetical protein